MSMLKDYLQNFKSRFGKKQIIFLNSIKKWEGKAFLYFPNIF